MDITERKGSLHPFPQILLSKKNKYCNVYIVESLFSYKFEKFC